MIQVSKLDLDRYYVKINSGGEYLTDISEFGGNGWCNCKDFEYKHQPILIAQQELGLGHTTSRCKHLRLLFFYLGKGKSKEASPTPQKEDESPLEPEESYEEKACNCNSCVCGTDDSCDRM